MADNDIVMSDVEDGPQGKRLSRKQKGSKMQEVVDRITGAEPAVVEALRAFGADRALDVQQELAEGDIRAKEKGSTVRALNNMFDMAETHAAMTKDKERTAERRLIADEIDHARLGYASICFATSNDLGRGPTIARGVLNPRHIKPSGVSRLKNLYLNQMLNQQSHEPSYHITVLVRKKALKADKLAEDIMTPVYPEIEWVDDITNVINSTQGDLALVADGNHRATVCEQLNLDAKAKFIASKTAVATGNTAETNSPALKVHQDTVLMTEKILRSTCSWHCVLYDWDLIESSNKKDAILLMLSENDVFFSQPDNNTEALFHLLLSIAGRSSKEVDALLQVHRQARTSTSSQESIFKDKEGLMVYAAPYVFQGLRDTPLYRPSFVYAWQQCAVEIAGPYMTMMTQTLLWLASPEKFVPGPPNTIEMVHDQVLKSQEALQSITDTSLFDCHFFQILEMAYKEHLGPALITFGQGKMDGLDVTNPIVPEEDDQDEDVDMEKRGPRDIEIVWEKAFATYKEAVCKSIEAWVQRKLPRADIPTRLVLDALVPKINFLYANGMLGDHKILPKTDAPLPLLSILFFMDLAKSLADVSDGISMAFNWFEPLLVAMSRHQHLSEPTRKDTRKPPVIFREWLTYHFVREKPIHHVALNKTETIKSHQVAKTYSVILGQIVKQRHSCLPLLSKYMQADRDCWLMVKEWNCFYKSIEEYEKKMEKQNKIADEWNIPAIHLSLFMLDWRSKAQHFEKRSGDPDYDEHHAQRPSKSLVGTFYRPGPELRPKLSLTNPSDSKIVDKLADILDLTACNWAEFYNKNPLVMKYVRFVVYSREMRRSYRASVFKDPATRVIFEAIIKELEGYMELDIIEAVKLPKYKGKEKEVEEPTSVYEGIAYPGLELLDQDLRAGIQKLGQVIKEHGLIQGKLPETIAKPYSGLLLALTGVNLWKKATIY